MLLRVFLLSWWPFSGYSGSESVSGVSLPNSMLKFLARFILFNFATFILWFFIHSYYETAFGFIMVKANQIFGLLPFTDPKIINGELVCRFGGKATCHFNMIAIVLSIFITIPLILSSSGVGLLNRIKMILTGLVILFFFQLLLSFIITHADIYENYPLLLQRGMKIDRIISYTPAKAMMFLWLNHFFKNVLLFPVAVGIWVGVVSYYKKSYGGDWIRNLF